MNLRDLAVEISKIEGGKKNLSIAQISEVLKCLGVVLKRTPFHEAIILMLKLAKLNRK